MTHDVPKDSRRVIVPTVPKDKRAEVIQNAVDRIHDALILDEDWEDD